MCWRLGGGPPPPPPPPPPGRPPPAPNPAGGAYDAPPDPLIVRGNAPSPLATLYFVSIFTSQFPFQAPPLRNSWIRHWRNVLAIESTQTKRRIIILISLPKGMKCLFYIT